MGDQFFLRSSGKVMGPFTWTQLQDLRKRGRLHEFHELSSDRMTWLPAGSLPELFPPPPQGASAPQPGPAPGDLQWFYADAGGERRGPVARHQLGDFIATGRLAEESLVWMKGMPDWKPAVEAVPDLFHTAAPPLRGGATGDWRTSRIAVTLAIVAGIIFGTTIVMFCLTVIIMAINSPHGGNPLGLAFGGSALMLITLILFLSATVLEMIAFGYSCTAPASHGAHKLGITTLILAIAYLVISVSAGVGGASGLGNEFGFASPQQIVMLILGMLSGLLWIAYRVTFLFFLRAVALACHARGLAQNIVYLIILFGVLVFVIFLFQLFTTVRPDIMLELAHIILILFFVMAALGLGWLTWYTVVLFHVRLATGGTRRA